ncbi:MAG: UTP--glucose-1-phosphate uridylyltransferase [Campylobacterales bacterium]|nr:UTP--glucose-1-phosphate uridylyltransferase [Campylobacterales bacterium]
MRIDKYINAVNLTKRRAIAQDMIKHNAVFLNEVATKASKDVKVGDKIEFKYLDGRVETFEVLQIPNTKTIPKSKKDQFVKEL